MDYSLTLDKILELPNDILKNAEKYDEYSELLGKIILEDTNIELIKSKVINYFNHFKEIKYLYKFPINNIKITSSYEIHEGTRPKKTTSAIEQLVLSRTDEELWAENFYEAIITVSRKLTLQEAIYLVDSFLGNKSDEFISEKIGICRNTLQKVKKSCLVKIWSELKFLDLEDNE